MRTRTRLLLAALTAAMALTIVASSANAARSFEVDFPLLSFVSPGLTFTGAPGGNQVICAVTLTASLHRLISKVRGSLVGFVNGSRTGNCRNSLETVARAIALVSHRLPWHITLNSFRGTLPRITEILITINEAKFLLENVEPVFGRIQGCLYRGNIGVETRGRTGAAEYTAELLIPQRGSNIANLFEDRLNASFGACEASGALTGTFHAILAIVIRLV